MTQFWPGGPLPRRVSTGRRNRECPAGVSGNDPTNHLSHRDYSDRIRNAGLDGGTCRPILARPLSLARAIEIPELRAQALTLEDATIDAVFILEFRHTRTADEPGKSQSRARHGGAVHQAYARRQRETSARTMRSVKDCALPPKRAQCSPFRANYLKRALLRYLTLATLSF